MQNVTGKIVLVTGASSGIGEATARLLAKEGARVVLGARRVDRLENIVGEIRVDGGEVDYRPLDVTDPGSVREFVAFARQKFGRVDVMFNNAGIMPLSPLNGLKVDEWNDTVDVNIKGVLHGIAAVLPVMEAQGSGHIINTASTAAYTVGTSCAVYCASKYAVRAITEGLRQETDKIRVTLISPSVTKTELGNDITDEAAVDFLAELRKTALSSEDIASAVLYAVSRPAGVDVSEVIIRPTAISGHSF